MYLGLWFIYTNRKISAEDVSLLLCIDIESAKICRAKFGIFVKSRIYLAMVKALECLGRHSEIMKLRREELKLNINLYNKWQMNGPDTNVFHSYVCFVQSQIQNKLFGKALKTCSQIRMYNLNSSNPLDTLRSLRAEDYKSYFPNSSFSIEDDTYFENNNNIEDTQSNFEHQMQGTQEEYIY